MSSHTLPENDEGLVRWRKLRDFVGVCLFVLVIPVAVWCTFVDRATELTSSFPTLASILRHLSLVEPKAPGTSPDIEDGPVAWTATLQLHSIYQGRHLTYTVAPVADAQLCSSEVRFRPTGMVVGKWQIDCAIQSESAEDSFEVRATNERLKDGIQVTVLKARVREHTLRPGYATYWTMSIPSWQRVILPDQGGNLWSRLVFRLYHEASFDSDLETWEKAHAAKTAQASRQLVASNLDVMIAAWLFGLLLGLALLYSVLDSLIAVKRHREPGDCHSELVEWLFVVLLGQDNGLNVSGILLHPIRAQIRKGKLSPSEVRQKYVKEVSLVLRGGVRKKLLRVLNGPWDKLEELLARIHFS